jgi:hypothetical protein
MQGLTVEAKCRLELGKDRSDARGTVGEFQPQGISNMAWSLSTCGLLASDSSRSFLLLAAAKSTSLLSEFHPQAISQFSLAIAKLSCTKSEGPNDSEKASRDENVILKFMKAVADEATVHRLRFEARDLCTVAEAVVRSKFRYSKEAKGFADSLAQFIIADVGKIENARVMVNMSIAVARMKVDRELLDRVAAAVDRRCCNAYWTSKDMEEWQKFKQKVGKR